jgi:uncharacterized protein with HEPN domain
MPKRDDLLLKDDILDCFKNILQYTQNHNYESFVNSQITIDAVIRNFEVIGEAANYISEEFKINSPEIEWRKLTDFRNKLIHHYFGINYEIVWEVIQKEVVNYIEFLEII